MVKLSVGRKAVLKAPMLRKPGNPIRIGLTPLKQRIHKCTSSSNSKWDWRWQLISQWEGSKALSVNVLFEPIWVHGCLVRHACTGYCFIFVTQYFWQQYALKYFRLSLNFWVKANMNENSSLLQGAEVKRSHFETWFETWTTLLFQYGFLTLLQ